MFGSNRGATAFFSGSIDEMSVYDSVLSDYEVYALAQTDGIGVGGVRVGLASVDFVTTTRNANPITWQHATLDSPFDLFSTWTFNDAPQTEGYYDIRLETNDAAGNVSGNRIVWRGLIDTIAPTLTVTATQASDPQGNFTTYVVNAGDFLLDIGNSDLPCGDDGSGQSVYDDGALPYDGKPFALAMTCRVTGWDTMRDMTVCDAAGNCTTVTVSPNTIPTAVSVGGISADLPVLPVALMTWLAFALLTLALWWVTMTQRIRDWRNGQASR